MTERRATTKRCARCGLVKPLDSFYRYAKGKHGRTSRCKQCTGAGPMTVTEARSRPTLLPNPLTGLSPDWHTRGACRHIPAGNWLEVDPGVHLRRQRQMKALELAICAECPVLAECGEAGAREPLGIWGGLLPKERRMMRMAQ